VLSRSGTGSSAAARDENPKTGIEPHVGCAAAFAAAMVASAGTCAAAIKRSAETGAASFANEN
jgi:hypothetical protein